MRAVGTLSIWLATLLMACQWPARIAALPHRADEVVMVEELVRLSATNASENNATATLITVSEASGEDSSFDGNESDEQHANDDLIFLTKKPQQQQREKQEAHIEANKQRIDLLTSASTADDDSNDDNDDDNNGADNIDADADADDDRDMEETETAAHSKSNAKTVEPIDMSDFLALIPAAEVKSIAANYYRNDPEVQRAYAFLSSRHFAEVREHILQLPEMKAFLRYLNGSGLNVLGFLQTLTNMTCNPPDSSISAQHTETMPSIATTAATMATTATTATATTTMESSAGNEIENRLSITTHRPNELRTTTTTTTAATTTTMKAQLNGLHGLVDSILDILPQDQILATFFDKLETNEQFSKLVDSIGTPKFAKILSNMQNSAPLRSLIFTLHSNGIYIARIVDSLKSYFFLGTL